jgi:cyclic-di-GMP phosphodiesterase TipF (flagellum assembly factor)
MATGAGASLTRSRLLAVLHPAASLLGGAAVGGAAWLSGAAGIALSAVGGLLAAAALHGALGSSRFQADRRRLTDAQRLLLDEILSLRARLSDAEAKLDAPRDGARQADHDSGAAPVWRGIAGDIDVLGALVRDVAKTQAEHERRLALVEGREVQGFLRPVLAEPEAPPPPEPAAPPEPRPASATPYRPPLRPAETESPVTAARSAPAGRLAPLDRSRLRSTLASVLDSPHLELCLQPVLSLPQRRTIGYRASLRIRPGEEAAFGRDLGPGGDPRRLALLAENSLDHDVRLVQRALQVLRVLRSRGRSVTVTCRVARASLTNPAFVPEIRLASAGDAGLTALLRLELAAFDMTALGAMDSDPARELAATGAELALTDIGNLRLDPAALRQAGVTQVDIPAQVLTGQGGGDIRGEDLPGFFGRAGIAVLASGVQSEATVPELIDLDVIMASGPLFGEARPVRAEVLEPTPVASAPPPAAAAPVEAAVQRQSFRSLLRRA